MGNCFKKKKHKNFEDNKNEKIDFQKIDDTISETQPSDLEMSDHQGAFDKKAKEQEMAALTTQVNELTNQLEDANKEIRKRKK